MGIYINPPGESKEQWLEREAIEAPAPTPESFERQRALGWIYVGLVRNPMFSAAGVVFDERERRDFTDPTDLRPHRWFLVPIDKVKQPDIVTPDGVKWLDSEGW